MVSGDTTWEYPNACVGVCSSDWRRGHPTNCQADHSLVGVVITTNTPGL